MILEPDQFYYEAGKYVWSPERRTAAWERCYRLLEAALSEGLISKVIVLVGIPASGKSTFAKSQDADDVIIFDGVFAGLAQRARVLQLATTAGVPAEAVWMDTPWVECVARNDRRSLDRRIPIAAMQRMAAELAADPVSAEEGFVRVERLRPGAEEQSA